MAFNVIGNRKLKVIAQEEARKTEVSEEPKETAGNAEAVGIAEKEIGKVGDVIVIDEVGINEITEVSEEPKETAGNAEAVEIAEKEIGKVGDVIVFDDVVINEIEAVIVTEVEKAEAVVTKETAKEDVDENPPPSPTVSKENTPTGKIAINKTKTYLLEKLNIPVIETYKGCVFLDNNINMLSSLSVIPKWDMRAPPRIEKITTTHQISVSEKVPFKVSLAAPNDAKLIDKILLRYGSEYTADDIIEEGYKKILRLVHPDKNSDKIEESTEDFKIIKNMHDKFFYRKDEHLIIKKEITKQEVSEKILPPHYSEKAVENVGVGMNLAKMGLKGVSVVVDILKLIQEPTSINLDKLTFDVIMSLQSVANVVHDGYPDSYAQYFAKVINATPSLETYSIVLNSVMLGWQALTCMNDIRNIVSQLSSLYSSDAEIRSLIAYKDLYLNLKDYSPIPYIADNFAAMARDNELKVNELKLEIREAQIQAILEGKGELGHKLYHYFYAPILKEEYELSNKVVLGELTREQAESLETKHVKITLADSTYESCVRMNPMEGDATINADSNEAHYYCYNEAQQILDHLILNEDGYVEVIESFT